MKTKFNYKPWLTALCLAGSTLVAGPAFAVDPPPPVFQLDGNAQSTETGHSLGDDWDMLNYSTSTGGNSIQFTNLIKDRPEPQVSIFTTGGSKDELDINRWRWSTGTTPPKDDLTNAYAAAYANANNEFILVFGMDRYDTNGDAQLGFWFVKDAAFKANANGTFSGLHQEGDVLVLVNFSNGGVVPTVEVFQWTGGAATPVSTGNQVLCTNGDIPSTEALCGITNATPTFAPWTYINKDVGTTTTFPPGAFFEGAINLTKLLQNDSPCFTNFLAESRSSTSITAILKDLAMPDNGFNVCSIKVTKACKNPRLNADQSGILYDIVGKVTNSAFGTAYNIALSDSLPINTNYNEVNCDTGAYIGNFPITLLKGGVACYQNTLPLSFSENGSSDTMTVTANTASVGGISLTGTSDPAKCPELTVSPILTLTKTCDTKLTLASNNVAAEVFVTAKACNTSASDSRLDNIIVTDDKAGTLAPPKDANNKDITSALPGTCLEFTGSYTPTAPDQETNDPALATFSDTATVTATDVMGKAVPRLGQPVISGNATCPLCDKLDVCK